MNGRKLFQTIIVGIICLQTPVTHYCLIVQTCNGDKQRNFCIISCFSRLGNYKNIAFLSVPNGHATHVFLLQTLCFAQSENSIFSVQFPYIYFKPQCVRYENFRTILLHFLDKNQYLNERKKLLQHEFLRSTSLLYKILPTNLGACKPTFYTLYTSHLR